MAALLNVTGESCRHTVTLFPQAVINRPNTLYNPIRFGNQTTNELHTPQAAHSWLGSCERRAVARLSETVCSSGRSITEKAPRRPCLLMPAAATARLLLLGGGCDVELKENHIAVFHDVFFAFHAECRARSSLLSASPPRKHAHMYTHARARIFVVHTKRHEISRLFGTCRLCSGCCILRGLLWSLCMLCFMWPA